MTSKYSSIDGGRLLADHEPILLHNENMGSERMASESATGASDLSYNNMLLRPDGTVMTVEQIKDLRQRQGYCLTCPGEPVKLYAIKKSKFNPLYKSKEPIHAVHLSDNGVCLRCNPGMDPNRGHRRGSIGGGGGGGGVDMMPVHSIASPAPTGHVQTRRRNSIGGPVVGPPTLKSVAITAVATHTIDHRGTGTSQAPMSATSPTAASRASPPSGGGHKTAKRSLSPKLFSEHQGGGSSHGVTTRELDDPFGRRDRDKRNSSNRSMHRSLSPTRSMRLSAEGRMGSDRSNFSSKSSNTPSQKQLHMSMEIDPNEWNDFANFPSAMEPEPNDPTPDSIVVKSDDSNKSSGLRQKLERKDSVDSDGFLDQQDDDRQSVQSGFQSSFLNFDPNSLDSNGNNMLGNDDAGGAEGSTLDNEDDSELDEDDDDALFYDEMKQAIKNSLEGPTGNQSSESTSDLQDESPPQESPKTDGDEQQQQYAVAAEQDASKSSGERYVDDHQEEEDSVSEPDSEDEAEAEEEAMDNRLTEEELQDELLDRMNMLQATLSSLVGSTESRLSTIEKQVTSVLQQQSILLAQHATILKLMQQQRLQSLTNGSAHGGNQGASNSSLSYSHVSLNAHGVETTAFLDRSTYREAPSDVVSEASNSRRSHRGSRRRLMEMGTGGSSRRRRKSREVDRLASSASGDHNGIGHGSSRSNLDVSDRSMDVPGCNHGFLQDASEGHEGQEPQTASARRQGDEDMVEEKQTVMPAQSEDDVERVRVKASGDVEGEKGADDGELLQGWVISSTANETPNISETATNETIILQGEVADPDGPLDTEDTAEIVDEEKTQVEDIPSYATDMGSHSRADGNGGSPRAGTIPTEPDDKTVPSVQNETVETLEQDETKGVAMDGSPLEGLESEQLTGDKNETMTYEHRDDESNTTPDNTATNDAALNDNDVGQSNPSPSDSAAKEVASQDSDSGPSSQSPKRTDMDSMLAGSPNDASGKIVFDSVAEIGNTGEKLVPNAVAEIADTGSRSTGEGVSSVDSRPQLDESGRTKSSRRIRRTTSSDEAENHNEGSRRRSNRKLKRGTSRRSGDSEDLENGSSRRKHSSRRVKSSSNGLDGTIHEDDGLSSSDRRKGSSRRIKRGASAGCEGRNSLAHLTVAEEGRRRSRSSGRIHDPARSTHDLEDTQGATTEAETTDFEEYSDRASDRASSVHNSEPIPEMDALRNGEGNSHEVSQLSVTVMENEEMMKSSKKDSGDAERRKPRKGKRTVSEHEVIAALGLKNERKEKKKKSSDRRVKAPKRERKSARAVSNGGDPAQNNEFSEASAHD